MHAPTTARHRTPFHAATAALFLSLLPPGVTQATSLGDAITGGAPHLDMRLRDENVHQANALKDADALTLRTRLGYATGTYRGLSAYLGAVDVTALGSAHYNSTTNGKSGYSVVADPSLTAVDQAWVAWAAPAATTLKYGRQVLILDNARFVGNVGWRQNEQTFDAVSLVSKGLPDTTLTYAYLYNVNTVTGTDTDIRAHLLNARYAGLPHGTLSAYGYFLDFPAAPTTSQKTVGLRWRGTAPVDAARLGYSVEYAHQSPYRNGAGSVDANYLLLEGAVGLHGVTGTLGYEKLGGDGRYGFQTPLATKHAFNGWADQFLVTPASGLRDRYLGLATKQAGTLFKAVYHDFRADSGGTDLGTEWDVLALHKFGTHYAAGVKYASYAAGAAAAGKVDTDKIWVWGDMHF